MGPKGRKEGMSIQAKNLFMLHASTSTNPRSQHCQLIKPLVKVKNDSEEDANAKKVQWGYINKSLMGKIGCYS
jgi:hypothetical protein